MSERDRYVMYCLNEMLTILEEYQEWHNRQPLTRLMRWLYGN
jgi:hypothetical protein